MNSSRAVLYVVICAAGPATDAIRLVDLATKRGWDTYAIPTPSAVEFLDLSALESATGHPVRVRYRKPGEAGKLPHADAVVVAPATYNTVNKWAAGISDTFALGLLAEMTGLGVPTSVLPFVNSALASQRVYQRSINELRKDGIRVLADDIGNAPHAPGAGGSLVSDFPWQLALDAVEPDRGDE